MTTPDPAGNYPEPDPPHGETETEESAGPAGEGPSGGTDPERADVGRAGAGGAGGGDARGSGEGTDEEPVPGPAEWTVPAGGAVAGESPSPWAGAGSATAGGQRPVTDDGVEWSTPTWSDGENAPAPPAGGGYDGPPPPYPPPYPPSHPPSHPPNALHPQPGVPYQQSGPLGGPTEGWPPTGRPQPMAGAGSGSRTAAIIGVAAAAVLLLCCVGAVVGALIWGRQVADQVRERDRDSVGLNQPARDGDLEFLVTSVTCGVERLGDGLVDQPASGQFCLVDVVVSNVGDQPVAFSDMLQRAYGPSERRYAADSAAGLLANREQQVFLNEINPGNEITAVLVYDIPAEDRIVRLVLRESDTSPGVAVDTA